MPSERVTVFAPTAGRPPSMVSALAPGAIPLNGFTELVNLRAESGALVARPPTVQIAAAPFGGAVGRGLWAGRLDGIEWFLGAWSDGTRTRIYESADGVAWTEATVTAGAYGNTRFETPGEFAAFAMIDSPDLGDSVVIQNGVDLPRVYSRTARNGQKVAVLREIDYPEEASDARPGAKPSGALDYYGDEDDPAVVVGSGTDSFATAGNVYATTAGAHLITGTDPTTINAGSSFVATFPSATSFAGAARICVFTTATPNATKPDAIAGFAIECWNGATWTMVYDPSAPPEGGWNVETIKGYYRGDTVLTLLSFDVAAIANSGLTNVSKLRFTQRTTTTYEYGFTICATFGTALAGLGAGASYRVSLFSSGNGSESAGVTTPAGSVRPLYSDIGMGPSGAVRSQADRVPEFSDIAYRVAVPIVPPTEAQRDLGVDTVKVYRQDVGSSEYLFAFSVEVSTYSGGWSYAPGRSALSYETDAVRTLSLESARYAPDAYAKPVPKGSAMIAANGRLHVGGDGEFAVSEQFEPLRFRSVVAVEDGQVVSRSSVRGKIPGERVMAYAAVAGSALAASSVLMHTDRALYSVAGFDAYALAQPTRIAEVGCLAPRSVVATRDRVYWLDDRRQVRRFSPGALDPISRRAVDDRTKGVPNSDAALCVGAPNGDGYMLFHRQAGRAVADRALVYEADTETWGEDANEAGAVACATDRQGRRIVQASDGTVQVHASEGSSGTVAVRIVTGYAHAGPWPRLFLGRVGVICDSQGDDEMAVLRRGLSERTDASSLSLVEHLAGGLAWVWDRRAPVDGDATMGGAPAGLSDVGVRVELSADLPAGARILGIVAMVQSAGEGAE